MRCAIFLYTVVILTFFLYVANSQTVWLPAPGLIPPLQTMLVCGTVNGQASSPTTPAPFVNPFRVQPQLRPSKTVRNPTTGAIIDYYDLDVSTAGINLGFPSATNFYTVNGIFPGPTIRTCKGRQALVRVQNNLLLNSISIHFQGQQALAPFDGHHLDVINSGHYKDYVLPNNGVVNGVYRDNSPNSAKNNFMGLVGAYIVDDCSTCTSPPPSSRFPARKYDLELIIADHKVDATYQLVYSTTASQGVAGDLNSVNGVLWPFMNVEARRYRFRIQNASSSRSYLLNLNDGSSMYLIGTEGGLLAGPPVALSYLKIAPSERYDLVFDFTGFPIGTIIYLLNGHADAGSPSFCQSHLLVKFIVTANADPAVPNPPLPASLGATNSLASLIPAAALAKGVACTAADRVFTFSTSGSDFLLNGNFFKDTIQSFLSKLIAQPKRNAVETWKLVNQDSTAWFFPHIHGQQFLVAYRKLYGVQDWERNGVKDSVFLGPKEEVCIVLRVGPHDGSVDITTTNLYQKDNNLAFLLAITSSGVDPLGTPVSPKDRTLLNPFARPAKPTLLRNVVTDAFLLENLNFYEVFYPADQATKKVLSTPYEVNYTSPCQVGNPTYV